MKRTSLHCFLSITAALFFITAIMAGVTIAQFNQVDPAFQPVPSTPPVPPPNGLSKGQIIQPDGKVVVWIGNLVVNGVAKGHIGRLNADGTLDNSFHYCSCLLNALTNVALQSDGKLLVAGYDANTKAKVVRLNPDGSADLSYNTAFPEAVSPGSSQTFIWLVQSDGKAYVSVSSSNFGFNSIYIYRVNSDGSLDSGFLKIPAGGGQHVQSFPTDFLENGGKLYMAQNASAGGLWSTQLSRFNLDGTSDSAWQRPTFGNDSQTHDIDFQSDGSMILSGRFTSVNGFLKSHLARILPAGNVDLAFTAGPTVFEGGFVKVLVSGKLLWSPRVSFNSERVFYRLNSDGSIDGTFVDPPSLVLRESKWQLDSMERIYFYGGDARFHRLNPNGEIDTSFAPDVQDFGTVNALARQPDGYIILSGVFSRMNGEPRPTIARVKADGSLDTSFNPGTGFDVPPTELIIQPDGKILAVGLFSSYNGASRNGIVRLNSDGGLDPTFIGDASGVRSAALQADGKIVIGGAFTSVNGTARSFIARLLSNGALDTSFSPILGGCCGVYDILVQADGKIMIAGGFTGVDGFSRPSVARLNSDGTLDPSFNSANLGTAEKIESHIGGTYLVMSSGTLRRRNSDGSADSSFPTLAFQANSGNQATIDAMVVEPTGAIIIGGDFITVDSVLRPNFLRLTPNGVIDLLFYPNGPNRRVRAVIEDGPGRVTIGGEFWKIGDAVRAGVARLSVAPFRKATPFDFDGDGRADISVVRTSSNRWYEVLSSTGAVHEETFGIAGDILTPADFDGDGITDEAVYRPAASISQWWYRSSLSGGLILNQFGGPTDTPRPSDFDGDGKADLVLFNPSNGVWSRFSTLTRQASSKAFGLPGDQPLIGDFDGDGKSDLAIFRPSNGDWWYAASSAGEAFRTVHWGQNGDIPVPADYDGDGKTDYAVFRPSDGGWYVYNSANGSFSTTAFGTNGDRPVAADYDGDGRADLAVFRPSTGIWYLLRSTAGFAGYQFGISTDTALPGALIP